jgi:hypothetical protein
MTTTRRSTRRLTLAGLALLVTGCALPGDSVTTSAAPVASAMPSAVGSVTPGISTARPAGAVRVPGTSVWMVPSAGFLAASSFAGFAEASGAAIEVTTVPEPYAVIAPQVTAAELATQGIDVDTRDEVTLAGGRPGILVSGTQTINGVDTQKVILVTGDDTTTAFVTANVPFASPDDIEPLTVQMLLSTWFEGDA